MKILNKKVKKNEERIWTFIHGQTVLNIATAVNNDPYCASCFYFFDEKNKLLVFKSKKDSRHITDLLTQPKVAGTILPDQHNPRIVKGIQFQGNLIFPNQKLRTDTKEKYYNKFPYARAVSGHIWIIQLDFIKMTDNQLGFGKKVIWSIDS